MTDKKIIIAGEDLTPFASEALESACGFAEWLLAVQLPEDQNAAESGTFLGSCGPSNGQLRACNWNLAFASMGLLAAYHHFGDERYRNGAVRMMRYLKSLQIFSPFLKEHYGAFREMTPQTPWCFVRDALSAAWGMLEFYRETGDAEYLERAELWYQWFRKQGIDEHGWPLWGVQFEPGFSGCFNQIRINNELHGSFHGGSLNFFYQLYKTTGKKEYVGDFYRKIADIFVGEIQREDGYFHNTLAATGKPADYDPQKNLHRGNDDLGTLGLIGAWRLTGDERYIAAIRHFFDAVFANQDADGGVEISCAPDPVLLNAVYEASALPDNWRPPQGALSGLLRHLFSRRIDAPTQQRMHGGLNEFADGWIYSRSVCYSLIVLLKIFGCGNKYLSAD